MSPSIRNQKKEKKSGFHLREKGGKKVGGKRKGGSGKTEKFSGKKKGLLLSLCVKRKRRSTFNYFLSERSG